MERDLTLLFLGGVIGIAGTTIGALLNHTLQRYLQRRQWAHEESLRREQIIHDDIDKIRGTRDVRTVITPGRFYCFPRGTLVTMGNRTMKPIDELQTGDGVLTYDRVSRRFSQARVVRIVRAEASELLLLNDCLAVTASHLIYAGDSFIPASDVRPGMYGLSDEGERILIRSIAVRDGRCEVFHIDLDSGDAFFAQRLSVGSWLAKQPAGERGSDETVEVAPDGEVVPVRPAR